jgi:hypothetical protein
MSRTHPVLRYTRWSTRWPILYGNEEFVAKGTVLAVAATEWHMVGPMPVRPGMCLNFWVWPPKRPKGLLLEGATVLWVKGFQFGLDVQNMDPVDRKWLTPFLNRTLGCWLVSRAA